MSPPSGVRSDPGDRYADGIKDEKVGLLTPRTGEPLDTDPSGDM